MKKRVILIIIAVIAALALLITGTVLLLKSKFVSRGNDNNSSQNPVTSSDSSGNNGSTDSSDSKINTSDGNNTGTSGETDSSSKAESSVTPSGNTTTFTVGNVSGKKGDKISVPVELSSNQGFMGCLAKFNYDTSALKYTGYKRSSLLKDYELHEENGTIKFMTVEEKDVTANGTILYLEFEIISAKAQTSTVEIAIDKTSIANYDEQYVPVKTVNGSVTIEGLNN